MLDIIYHYTDANGLKGILADQTLWATHYRYLNDLNEMNYFLKIIEEILPKTLSLLNNCTKLKVINNIRSYFDFFLGNEIHAGLESYIISFCEKQDLLSQWRGYGKNAAYSIGFDKAKLKALLKKETALHKFTSYSFDKVKYVDIQKIPTKIYNQSCDLIKLFTSFTRSISDKRGEKIGLDILDNLLKISPFIKHIGFQEESEWRANCIGFSKVDRNLKALSHDHIIKFRNSGGTIVPYIELINQKKNLPIVEIIIGPSRNMHLRKKSVELMLNEKGYNWDIVQLSTIPYIGD